MLNLKKLTAIFAALALLGGLAVIAMAGTSDTQLVNIVVPSIVSVSVSGETVELPIVDVDVEVSDSTTADLTYVNNTTTGKKVSAKGDAIPTGITLKVKVGTEDEITLTTGDLQVVGSFTQTKATEDITYTASAAQNAAVQTHGITVTYTIADA